MLAERRIASLILSLLVPFASALAQSSPDSANTVDIGPYNGVFLADGPGLTKPIPNAHAAVLQSSTPWTIYCWIKTNEAVTAQEPLVALGNAMDHRVLAIDGGQVIFTAGNSTRLAAPARLTANAWHLIAAAFDGKKIDLYADGTLVGSGSMAVSTASPSLQMAPFVPTMSHFGGSIALLTIAGRWLQAADMQQMYAAQPDFSLIAFEEGSKPWPLQTRAQAGYRAPQDPVTLPRSRASFSPTVVVKRPPSGPSLTRTGEDAWTFSDGWTMIAAPKTTAIGAQISASQFNASGWMRATVPGTVLTTMVDNGIYPDPAVGLNNLAIPESLNKQDYWYRNEFTLPAGALPPLAHAQLTFEGINYAATIWLNGKQLGTVTGAFQRGTFDVTSALRPGSRNVLAVRISPPPHPGIPQEQSILGGPGENGGAMLLDGPTFVATEGWDWIPAVRDRNSGIWQPVTLHITRSLRIGDAQVVTSFHNHDTTRAAVEIAVPVSNLTHQSIDATVEATLEQTTVRKHVVLKPGETIVKLTPSEFAALNLDHPRLWWPNGYGRPELYDLELSIRAGGAVSDTHTVRFGVREVTYELSLLDSGGHLRRVEFSPTDARNAVGPVVDVSHEGMREIPAPDAETQSMPEARRANALSHVSSLAPGADSSPAIRPLTDTRTSPYLVLRVNGVRIASRGGNWGMDDFRKRVSRERLEPFFRLNRDAGLNIIRNWVGQSTEESFYQLADEYGMMVWNDFWESTENYNIEAQDPALFLANAADTIVRFRNHPSIVMWCGRNEGVPQPIINLGLDDLVRRLDGTRFYSPSSNAVNLQGSGPYRYQDPTHYFTSLNRGFSVETGTPSMSTLESFESTVAKADQWPIDDVWAYHDWHQSGNGDVAPFMAEIATEFGAAGSLEDFERKAQMLNYVDHRAMFEGMNANLWAPNSGRLLWMTQPAWPSTMWQILSSDYDTQASFYGVMKACEPLHVQLNLATYGVDVVNTTNSPRSGLTVSAKAYSLQNALLAQASERKDIAANVTAQSVHLDLAPLLARGMVLVELELRDAQGKVASQNLYWLGGKAESYRELNSLPAVKLDSSASSAAMNAMVRVTVELSNSSSTATLENKMTLVNADDNSRILPAYYSDNYVSLLPGEKRTVTIEYPLSAAHGVAAINFRGWNAVAQRIDVK